MADILREYYDLLQGLQNSASSVITTIPDTDNLIHVDLSKREIILPPAMREFLSIETDHRADTLYFEVDRYYDNVDLARQTIVIEYVNAKKEGRVYPVLLKDLSVPGKLRFGWCIGGEATKYAGDLKFSIHFFTIDPLHQGPSGDHILLYSLHTQPVTGKIQYGMEWPDQLEDYDFSLATIEAIYEYMDSHGKIFWTDL